MFYVISKLWFLDEVEIGVRGLRARFWTDHVGDWYIRFVQMACQQDGTERYDYASVPILVNDYLHAPTQWVMANGNGGKIIIYDLLNHLLKDFKKWPENIFPKSRKKIIR